MVKRAFEGYLNMAAVAAKEIDGLNAVVVHRNIEEHLKSAFQMVTPSHSAMSLLGALDDAFRAFAVACHDLPLRPGHSAALDAARLRIVATIDALRTELHLCQPSDTARALGIE
ncbi:MAG: hypothetical protein K0M55_18625 [Rhizobium sp.]|nr:hypothetical protein [Rhizobium sp.]